MPPSENQKADETEQEIEVGDFIQWESNGALQMAEPMRVRAIQEDDGARWVFVEGSETGIPMEEAIFERKGEQGAPKAKVPPTLPLAAPAAAQATPAQGEREWLRGPLSINGDVSYRLFVTGKMTEKEIGKLMRILKTQKEVMEDFDVIEDDPIKPNQ